VKQLPRVLLVNDHPAWGGIGRYTLELDRALAALDPPEVAVDLLLQNMPGRVDPAAWRRTPTEGQSSGLTVQPRPRWAKPSGFGTAYLINSHLYFPRRIPAGYDLYHYSSQMMGASVRQARPAVVTVQDLIALRLGSNHPGLSTWLRRRHFGPLRQASGLVFASEYSRQDFLSTFDYPDDRTSVVHHAVAAGFAPRDRQASRNALQLAADRPILLHVGSDERRKDVTTLLEALPLLLRERPDLLLLRVGGASSRSRRVIARLGLERAVRYLPALSDAQLAACYSAADLFVFPSYYEGFGFPVLEAMKSGCPVVVARATSLPEIVGDAGVLFEPRDATALARSVGGLLDDPARRAALRALGIARAAEFTWERAARQTAAAYHRALQAG
jgi:glycosyltransferase involved in cell wall biosynthesis